jgi:GMP synthase-like glutamine amidotransferase
MKIAILCTSNDTSDFAKRFITDDQKYINLLSPLRPDWTYDCFAVWQDEFPNDVAVYDGVIITGSPASVNDEDPWIKRLLNLIREMSTKQTRLFGACFGHQAIAMALGGTVAKNIKGGWSVGTETTTFTKAPAYLDGVAQSIDLYSIHKEEVTQLPNGAVRIGTNPYCENPAFVIGNHVFTSQYHPEMTSDFLVDLVDEMRGYLEDSVLDAALPQFHGPHQGAEFARGIIQFFEA